MLTFLQLKMLVIDVIPNIFKYVNDGLTYKSILFSSKTFYTLMTTHYKDKRYEVYNPLLTLIKLYPEKDWHWGRISKNPCISMDFITKNTCCLGLEIYISKPEYYYGYDIM